MWLPPKMRRPRSEYSVDPSLVRPMAVRAVAVVSVAVPILADDVREALAQLAASVGGVRGHGSASRSFSRASGWLPVGVDAPSTGSGVP